MGQNGWLDAITWVFLDDSPSLFNGKSTPENALVVDGSAGLHDPCWGVATKRLAAVQANDSEAGSSERALAAKAVGEANISGVAFQSGAWSGLELLAGVCAERHWLPIA